MPAEPIVFVIDDDLSIQRALHHVLTTAGWRVEFFSSGVAFLDTYDPDRPGCVILELRLPQMSGLTVQEHLAAAGSLLSIVFLTAFGDIATAVQAIQSGAIDFIEKPFNTERLVLSVEKAIAQNAINREQQRRLATRDARLARLTPREHEVLALVVTGHTNKEIAVQLGIQLRTVEMHRQRVMRKMEVRSAVALVNLLRTDSA